MINLAENGEKDAVLGLQDEVKRYRLKAAGPGHF
jgi:hypothetical protein